MVGEAGDEGDGVVVWPSDCARVGSVESGPYVDISGEVGDAPVMSLGAVKPVALIWKSVLVQTLRTSGIISILT